MFFDAYVSGDRGLTLDCGSRIEGIGRPRVEASFLPEVIDAMVKVPDAWSLAAMHYLARRLGRRVGGSSGTNLIGALVARAANGRGRREGFAGGDSLRRRRTLCDHLLRSGLAGQAGLCAGTLVEALAACIERGVALPDGLLVAGL